MTWKTFLIQLVPVSALIAIGLIFMGQTQVYGPYIDLGWITWVCLVVATILIYQVGKKASNAANRNAFFQVVIISMLGKMFLAFILAMLYFQIQQPTENVFVVPLFVVYLGFTIYETYLLMKLSRPTGPGL
ncbi:MAG: hypothetical protein HKN16_04510 [Saprospiraceae bacterium]|nr:hypothetical protein [Saprospiraceae bacterium]